MGFLKEEFVTYMHEVKGNLNPGAYANGLENIEKILSVDIDEEFSKDGCQSLYDWLQELRRHPEKINKKERDVRVLASRLKQYIEFRKWKMDPARNQEEIKNKAKDSIGDLDVKTVRCLCLQSVE